jgi:outer membrane protein
MTIRLLLCFLLLAFGSSSALAQSNWVARFLNRSSLDARPGATETVQDGTIPLTTADVIRLLLENNRDVIVSRNVPISSLYSISSLYRTFQPNFHIIGALNHTETPSTNVLAGAVSLVQLSHDYRIGVDQALETGTSYSVDFNVSRNSSNSIFTVYNPAYNGSVQYQVSQHLLRDFGRLTNSHEIRIARNNEKLSELDFELKIVDLVSQALQSYWDLVFAAEDIKVKQRSLDLASKTLQDNQVQVSIGSLAPIDLVQAETEVAIRTEDLISAQFTSDQLQDQMKMTITSDIDPGRQAGPLKLIEPLHQPGADTILPIDQAIQFALENRRELKQADYDFDNQNINVQYTKNQMRPLLDLTAGYTHYGLGGTATIRTGIGEGSQVVRVIPGGVGDMFGTLFAFKYPAYNAGFTLQIPLSNRAARADYDRALNERELSEKRKAETAQRIVLEVRNAYLQIDATRSRVGTAHTTRELATRKLEAEQKKYDLGTSTVRFVLEEQRNLAQAETDEIQALVNYSKALVAYDRAIGNTLTRNHIELDKQLPGQLATRN